MSSLLTTVVTNTTHYWLAIHGLCVGHTLILGGQRRPKNVTISAELRHNYSCILQLSPAPGEGAGLECEIRLRTVMGRILPKCSLQRGQRSICRC